MAFEEYQRELVSNKPGHIFHGRSITFIFFSPLGLATEHSEQHVVKVHKRRQRRHPFSSSSDRCLSLQGLMCHDDGLGRDLSSDGSHADSRGGRRNIAVASLALGTLWRRGQGKVRVHVVEQLHEPRRLAPDTATGPRLHEGRGRRCMGVSRDRRGGGARSAWGLLDKHEGPHEGLPGVLPGWRLCFWLVLRVLEENHAHPLPVPTLATAASDESTRGSDAQEAPQRRALPS
mmetsp:Transcript_8043/g.22842  ORF Transcript_8043/g.22842 Transcript_8043/m.22842 type:complete len:232 (-) Transcript_8043:48-743(-)